MNSTTSARNVIQALAAFAVIGVAAFAFGLALDALVLPLFGLFASALTILTLARDYAPRAAYDTASTTPVLAFPAATERMPLAA